MAGHDDRDGVSAIGGADGAGGPHIPQTARQLAVAQRRPVRDGAQGVPHAALKRRARRLQWNGERRATPGEVLGELLAGSSENVVRGPVSLIRRGGRDLPLDREPPTGEGRVGPAGPEGTKRALEPGPYHP